VWWAEVAGIGGAAVVNGVLNGAVIGVREGAIIVD
jgi:hypothetical protein